MKPLYLEVEGIKSIAEKQTINFEEVAKSGIFGIFGKTGSGKTSILDSIVFAIYGSVTGSVENKDIVNTGGNLAKVTLIFSVTSMGETKKYMVERSTKFDKKRVNVTSTASLFLQNGEDWVSIAEGVSPVSAKLEEEIIGLDKKDFLKCIALPQGSFSEFIKLSRNERLKFVGKLFGLEKYGKPLADKISLKDRELKEEEIKLNGEIVGLQEYTQERIENDKKEFEQAKEELNAEKLNRDNQKQKYEEVKNLYNALCERQKKSDELNKKLGYKSVIDAYKQEIALFDGVKEVESELNTFTTESQKIKEIAKQLTELKSKAEALEKRKESAQENKEKLPSLQNALSKAQLKLETLPELQTKTQKLKEKKAELEKLRAECKKLTTEKTELINKIQAKKEESERHSESAKKFNVHSAIEELSKSISASAISLFVNDRIEFINSLTALLSSEKLTNESAVNRLIEGEIALLKQLNQTQNEQNVRDLLAKCIEVLDKNFEYTTKAQKAQSEQNALNQTLNFTEEKLADVTARGIELKAECEEREREINEILLGKTFTEYEKDLKAEIFSVQKQIEKINEEFDKVNAEIAKNAQDLAGKKANEENCKEQIAKAESAIKPKLLEKEITLDSALSLLKNKEVIQSKRLQVEKYEKEIALLNTQIGEYNEKLKDATVSKEDFEKEGTLYNNLIEKVEILNKKVGQLQTKYEIGLKKNQEWCIINKKLCEIIDQRKVYSRVYELVKESKFMEFIAEVYLKDIAREAERRVLSLTSGRYGLIYNERGFYVTDNLSGGKTRPALSLSGGETFLVSLSLALALSSQISRRAMKTLEFFFLDEGFGTLDDDLIDAVTASLENLRKSNLTVGLITHVAELKNRIGAKIEVTGATALHGTLITTNA